MRSLPVTLLVVTLLSTGLVGCAPQDSASPTTTPKPSASQQASQEPTSTPPATEPPAGYQSTPVTIDCNALVSPQAVYDYNPNYGLQPKFTPSAGGPVATILANQGVGCSWVNQTSGEHFVVAVAKLAAADLAAIQSGLAQTSSPASGFGDAAFFTASGGTGVAEVFQGGYWVVATSPAFYSIADAAPLLNASLTALR